MNQQPIEKRDTSASGFLEVHSIFHTIQGEGPFCGTPAVFIRLAGCNLQCPACDTDYTSNRIRTSPSAILEEVFQLAFTGLVVITGGEPFRQDVGRLINMLVDAGYYVQVETNGTLPPPADVPWWTLSTELRTGAYIVCSPKTGRVNDKIPPVASCFKYVVEADSVHADGLPLKALQHGSHPYVARPPDGFSRPVYIQPMDAHDPYQNKRNQAQAIDSCMKRGYILQLQVHKIINME